MLQLVELSYLLINLAGSHLGVVPKIRPHRRRKETREIWPNEVIVELIMVDYYGILKPTEIDFLPYLLSRTRQAGHKTMELRDYKTRLAQSLYDCNKSSVAV